MSHDPSKLINVAYNHLNLPRQITFGPEDNIQYAYTATGAKLRKTVSTMKTTAGSVTDYCGNFIYSDNQLITIFAGDVRVSPVNVGNSTYWKYEYSMKDHLGNTRVVFAAHSHGQPELLQQISYYPFGMTMQQQNFYSQNTTENKFLYNGKELQDDQLAGSTLDWYDYGARFYDATLGRWHVVDPLAHEFPSWSLYTFVYSNPLSYVDPDGRSGEPIIDKENRTVTIYSKLYFYGSAANSKLSDEIATGIASQLNAANAKTIIEDIEFDVKFRISYETVSEERANELAESNTSLRNNFIRVEDGGDRSSFSLMDNKGGNSFWFNTADELGSSTTPAHESGHGLGLGHPKGDFSASTERPHIMIPRNTPYGSRWSLPNDKGARVVNPNSRRVTQVNVSEAMKNNGGSIHNIIIKKDGKY